MWREGTRSWTDQHEIAALTAETLDFWLSLIYRLHLSRYSGRQAPPYESLRIVHPERRALKEASQREPRRGTVQGTKALLRKLS